MSGECEPWRRGHRQDSEQLHCRGLFRRHLSCFAATGIATQLDVNLTGSQLRGLDGGSGAYLDATTGAVSGNVITPGRGTGSFLNVTANTGIYDIAPGMVISGNTISDFVGAGIQATTSGTVITGNKVWGTSSGIDLGCNAVSVTKNTITGTGVGLAHIPISFTGVNTFYNVGSLFVKC